MKREIEEPVLAVLSAGKAEGNRYYLPARQLDRKMYESVNKVLAALGGKWNRGAKAHLFPADCVELIDGCIESGSYVKPSDMGWFPTPAQLAERIADLADIEPGMLVLEPSAGEGAIARELAKRGAKVSCVEIDVKRARKLEEIIIPCNAIMVTDFLTIDPEPIFDRVVMNPPFAKRADIHHVLHARKFLKAGGKLVSIMSGGINFREDRLTVEFRAECNTITSLPEGTFHESGTDVNTVIVTMNAK